MGVSLIDEFLTGDSKEIQDLTNNEATLVGFLTLIKALDDLPDMSTRFYEAPRSLYQVTSSGRAIDDLVAVLSEFFGPPAKVPGKSLPVALRFNPSVKYLGGIRKDQALFLKKLKTGSYYGALWPWQQDPNKIEVHLGFCSESIDDVDYNKLGTLVQKFLSKTTIETVSDVGGQIHGISLPSFLQMSEMEGATYTLKVTSGSRSGNLYLSEGSLVAAQFEDLTGNEAAYRIISWDNAAIRIEAAEPDRTREIHEPLMHVMMESLKIKDEAGAKPALSSSDSQTPPKPPTVDHAALPPVDAPEPAPKKPPSKVKKVTQPSTKPAQKKSPTKKVPPPLPKDSPVNVPFEKVTDRSVGKQDQMGRTRKLLIVLLVVILLAIAVFGGGNLLKKRDVSRRYDQLMADLAVTKELDAQIVLLMQYIKDHPRDIHRTELENKLDRANTEIEKQDYEKTILEVNRITVDEKYEKKALSLYTAFLGKYPRSAYTGQINEAIGGIRQLLGTAYFEDLKKVTTQDFVERLTAYRTYLEQFPQGTERSVVEKMIANLAEEYYDVIEKQTATCDDQKDWDGCIAQCDRFLSTFNNDAQVEKVRTLRTMLRDKKDVVELTAQAVLAVDDYASARKIYTQYLDKRPDTTQKKAIDQRIAALDADIARQAVWEKTAAYAANPANDIFSRIRQLDMYVENNAAGPYTHLAGNLRNQLDPELKKAIRVQLDDEARRQVVAREKAEQARRAQEAQRINALRVKVAGQLQPVASRFTAHSDGTVTDRITGLTWCLLDSFLDLGECIPYRSAKAYVQGLKTGDHTDWRLPNAGELATLYKNSPFFPGIGTPWYWTSESFARGYHRVVDVVTTVPETVFTRISKDEDDCGAVRAVR